MIGAIIGDIVGSRFEWNNHRSKEFELLPRQCFFTDDSVMSLAVCDALLRCQPDFSGLGGQAVRSIRDSYQFNETCQDTVPQALEAFFESTGFEDAIRNAISIGGDSDTLAAITGSVAEAYYGTPNHIRQKALTFLDERLLKILTDFERVYPANG